MESTEIKIERVIIAGVHTDNINPLLDTTKESMSELSELVETAGGEVVGEIVQNKNVIERGTYFGEGKLEEIRLAGETLEADMLVIDDELTGAQLRNIEEATNLYVIDRNMLILDIFAQRAKSAEGKIQVELAQLRYNLPRLSGMGKMLSRQGGGIGTKGPGETKMETDRRHIMRRVEALKEELAEIKKRRDLRRERRKKDNIKTAAIVGYTNAGKSTLINALTGADVVTRNRLFETLDLTSRELILSDSRPLRIIDTVGFIRRLPHQFIEAFKSTLEEAVEADVILHVVDASNEQRDDHVKVTNKLLSELGCEGKPVVMIYNKVDLLKEDYIPSHKAEFEAFISAKSGFNLDKLKEMIEEALPDKKKEITLLIPYTRGDIVSAIHQNELIISEEYLDDGTLITALMAEPERERYKEYAKL